MNQQAYSTHPKRQLQAAVIVLEEAIDQWDRYEHMCAAMALPTMRSASLDGRVSSSGHADPTAAQVEAHEPYFETAAVCAEVLGMARQIVAAITKAKGQTTDISKDVSSARCDGVIGDDPTCTRNAVGNIARKGVKHPTCWACKKRDQRARWDAKDGAA